MKIPKMTGPQEVIPAAFKRQPPVPTCRYNLVNPLMVVNFLVVLGSQSKQENESSPKVYYLILRGMAETKTHNW